MDLKGIEITWLGHAAFRFRTSDGTTVFVDPWLTNPSAPEGAKDQDRADAVFVTHGHFDHVGDTLDLVKATGAKLFCIHEISVWAEAQGVSEPVGCNKGGTLEAPGGIRATMVDAVHSSGISGDQGIVPGGEAAGWVLEFPGGPTVYHAGDTMVFGDMALIGELFRPDIALLPIGGWYTMDPRQAAKAGQLLGVSTVIPMHYGTFPILAGTPEELKHHAGAAFEVATLEIGRPLS